MTLEGLDQARRRRRLARERGEKCVVVGSRKNHALGLVEEPPRALIGKVSGRKTK